jgi:hypothetical protein
MSEKVIRLLLDDMEDTEVEADAGTVLFGLDGKEFAIDLGNKNASKLRNFLKPFVDAARPAGRARKSSPKVVAHAAGKPSGRSSEELQAIRDWARNNGHPNVSNKGRVAAEIQAAFDEAHAPGGSLFSATGT